MTKPATCNDPYFKVAVLGAMPMPQQLSWYAMHQDYSENFVASESAPSEFAAGKSVVANLLKGGRGHYGPLEHASIVFNVGWFPHSVMQQARTHRVGVSFDVQSMRYTGQRIIDCALGKLSFDQTFYLRPVGTYTSRSGGSYEYTVEQRQYDKERCIGMAKLYAQRVEEGQSYEQARGILPFDYRQHFVVSFNIRSLMHFLDLRYKLDAQLEIQALCNLIWPHFQHWAPAVAAWYETDRLHRARLAP
jgi:thymidylate synthase (FAD)